MHASFREKASFVNKLAKRLPLRVRIPIALALAVTLVGLIYMDRQNRQASEATSGVAGALQVVEATSRDFNGAPALALSFNQPLDAGSGYRAFLQVLEMPDVGEDGGKPVSGIWMVGEDRRQLLFPRVKPQARYLVRIVGGLRAENGARLGSDANFSIRTVDVVPAL